MLFTFIYSRLKNAIFILIFCSLLISLPALLLSREQYADEEKFFSYERFLLNQSVIDKIPTRGRTQTELKRFAVAFMDGIYAMSAGQSEEAEEHLLKASKIWPEYYATDFLLALLYENRGEYRLAARYYKSYLNKLKGFHEGKFRISALLIISITPTIEKYDAASELVTERMEQHGIDIASVRPAITVLPFIIYLVLFAVVGLCCFAVIRWALPYWREQYRIKHPPEGFWACKNCHTMNSDLNKVCEYCGKRPDKA